MTKLYKSEKWLRYQYLRLKKSMKEMADEAGCSELTIRRALDEFEIKR